MKRVPGPLQVVNMNETRWESARCIIMSGVRECKAQSVCTMSDITEESLANASRLVHCWNTYDKLVQALRENQWVLTECVDLKDPARTEALKRIRAAIEKAKETP